MVSSINNCRNKPYQWNWIFVFLGWITIIDFNLKGQRWISSRITTNKIYITELWNHFNLIALTYIEYCFNQIKAPSNISMWVLKVSLIITTRPSMHTQTCIMPMKNILFSSWNTYGAIKNPTGKPPYGYLIQGNTIMNNLWMHISNLIYYMPMFKSITSS